MSLTFSNSVQGQDIVRFSGRKRSIALDRAQYKGGGYWER
jgi:hypothetical protein